MKYVIINTTTNQIYLGPIDWKPRYIEAILQDDLSEDIVVAPSDVDNIPYEIFTDVWVLPIVSVVSEDIDPLTEQLAGPFWSVSENQATMSYTKVERPISAIKGDIREKITKRRKKAEQENDIQIELQNQNVTIEVDRIKRGLYYQKLIAMEENNISTVKWKFEEGWLTIDTTDLRTIISSLDTYIQEQFDIEANLIDEMEQLNTAEELIAFVQENLLQLPDGIPFVQNDD